MTSVDVRLADIDECFQGALVSPVCSVAPDGVPNVTRVEAIQRVGDDHVALERFGLTKTVRNMLANPRLQIILLAPSSGAQYRLNVLYERTERGGRVFERSRARIDAMAVHVLREAMHLEAVDICRVLSV